MIESVTSRPLPQGDPRQSRRDIIGGGQLRNWALKIGLEEGFSSTIAYFDNLPANSCEVGELVWKFSK